METTEHDRPDLAASPWLGPLDLWLLAEGRHLRPWQKLGAHLAREQGHEGTVFAVWAPHAEAVSVVGDFNAWDPARDPMARVGESGIWQAFVRNAAAGALYKFAVVDVHGHLSLRTDPYARATEGPPGLAARVCAPAAWRPHRLHARPEGGRPIAIYEVHAGSWKRPGGHIPDWDWLARELPPYVAQLGFTHIELLPVAEHPFYGSWGYQCTNLYAPAARYGSPDALRRFIDAAHAHGLGVILDWVPGHFPRDGHALARFDGTALYEYEDPREGVHRDWDTLIYNFARPQVRNFLIGNALYWVEEFGFDGLRFDAVASMLYRDYSRPAGEWIPNARGGRENLEAISFLQEVNRTLHEQAPGVLTIAEESTAFPHVSRSPEEGGLGFDAKWNMGWMHDTLRYFALDPVHRRWHHDALTFAMMYAYSERFVLPLSHDEVVHGKGSLLNKMAGDPWQRRANLRALLGLMYAFPGRKLLFMGAELATPREWNHDTELDWGLLNQADHAGVQRLVHDLCHLLRELPALFVQDDTPEGFAWIEANDAAHSVYSFLRWGTRPDEVLAVVCNLTPVVRHDWRIGVPQAGTWVERLNTDSAHYAGSNVGNFGRLEAEPIPMHGHPWSVKLTLPPLGVLWLDPEKPLPS
jgi:1,4-alpha-glucan branching enzyme